MTEWCIACLQDEVKVVASKVLCGVPLCTGCAYVFNDDPVALADMRKFVKTEKSNAVGFNEPGIEAQAPVAPVKQIRRDGHDYTPLTKAQIDKSVTLKSQGVPVKDIAKDLGVQEWRVQQQTPNPDVSGKMCECGKPLRHAGRCPEVKPWNLENADEMRAEAIRIYPEVGSMKGVSEKLGISYSTARRWLGKIELRSPNFAPQPIEEEPMTTPEQDKVPETVKPTSVMPDKQSRIAELLAKVNEAAHFEENIMFMQIEISNDALEQFKEAAMLEMAMDVLRKYQKRLEDRVRDLDGK